MYVAICAPNREVLASGEFGRSPMVGEIIWIDRTANSAYGTVRERQRYRVTDTEWVVYRERPGITSDAKLTVIVSEEPE